MEDIYSSVLGTFAQKVPVLNNNRTLSLNPNGGYAFATEYVTSLKNDEFICLDKLGRDFLLLCDATHTLEEMALILGEEYEVSFARVCALADLLYWENIIDLKNTKVTDRVEISTIGDQSKYIPMHLAIELTSKCNFRCGHCYRESGPHENAMLPLGIIGQTVKDLVRRGTEIIEITGGEPLMHPDALDFLKLCCDLPSIKMVVLLTNSYLLDKEFIHELKKHIQSGKLFFSTTLDSSLPDFHDKHRQFEGSWTRVVNAIEDIAKEGGKIRVVMNIYPNNTDDIEKTLLLAKNSGATIFALNMVQAVGRGVAIDWGSLEATKMEKLRDDLDYISNKYTDFLFKLPARAQRKIYKENCGLGHKSWTISPSGEVRPCVMFPEGLLALGNIITDSWERIASNPVIPLLQTIRSPGTFPACNFCSYNTFCPYCVQRAICATGENSSCTILKEHGLEDYINRDKIGAYRCPITSQDLLFQQ